VNAIRVHNKHRFGESIMRYNDLSKTKPVETRFTHPVIWDGRKDTDATVKTKHANRLYTPLQQQKRMERYFRKALAGNTSVAVGKPSKPIDDMVGQALTAIHHAYPQAPTKATANQYAEPVSRDNAWMQCSLHYTEQPTSYKLRKKSSSSHLPQDYLSHTIAELCQDALLHYWQGRAGQRTRIDLAGACFFALKQYRRKQHRNSKLTDRERDICWTLLRGQARRERGIDVKDIAYTIGDGKVSGCDVTIIRLLVEGYSQTDIATMIGTNKMNVSRIVQGIRERLPIDYFERETSTIPQKHDGHKQPARTVATEEQYIPVSSPIPITMPTSVVGEGNALLPSVKPVTIQPWKWEVCI
jgi:hypothetical protein